MAAFLLKKSMPKFTPKSSAATIAQFQLKLFLTKKPRQKMFDYWQVQSEKLLFPEIEWNKPPINHMTKQDRLQLIRNRFVATCKTALPGILTVSAQEIFDTVTEETAPALRESNDCTQDIEEMGFKPELEAAFDRVREAQEHEGEILLNRAERDQLVKDLQEYRKQFWLAVVPVNPFAD
jgi:hypothetical protein